MISLPKRVPGDLKSAILHGLVAAVGIAVLLPLSWTVACYAIDGLHHIGLAERAACLELLNPSLIAIVPISAIIVFMAEFFDVMFWKHNNWFRLRRSDGTSASFSKARYFLHIFVCGLSGLIVGYLILDTPCYLAALLTSQFGLVRGEEVCMFAQYGAYFAPILGAFFILLALVSPFSKMMTSN